MKYTSQVTIFFVVVLLFVVLYVMISDQSTYRQLPQSAHIADAYTYKGTVDIVISRYAEDLSWLCMPNIKKYLVDHQYKTRIIIYNKGDDDVSISHIPNNVEVVIQKLPNVGRCDHTYLYHMVANYNSLADVTIFLPGSVNMPHKEAKTIATTFAAYEKMNTAFVCFPTNLQSHYNFTLDEWLSSDNTNRTKNTNPEMKKSEIRPFGKWYETMFGDVELSYLCLSGIFAVSKNDIHHCTFETLQDLLSQLDDHNNPEVGHYVERSWTTIFHPISPDCIIIGG